MTRGIYESRREQESSKLRITNFNLYFQDTYFVSKSQGLHYVTTFGGILFERLKHTIFWLC